MGLFSSNQKTNLPQKKFMESDSAYGKRLEKDHGILLQKKWESDYAFKRRLFKHNAQKRRIEDFKRNF